jgi:hypothetical protein
MKNLTYVVYACVVGVAVCLCGTIYTAYERHQAVKAEATQPHAFPTPSL